MSTSWIQSITTSYPTSSFFFYCGQLRCLNSCFLSLVTKRILTDISSLILLPSTNLEKKIMFPNPIFIIGEGNGNPIQCSCLENPRDGGALWASVCGVTRSWTRLKWLSSSSSNPILPQIYSCTWVCEPAGTDPPTSLLKLLLFVIKNPQMAQMFDNLMCSPPIIPLAVYPQILSLDPY